nr:hypothetical protein [Tanacetum cinerariifolium]
GKLIQKLLLNQNCMGYLVRAYYSISYTRYCKDDSCWSADLKLKTTEDIISNRSFMKVLVLNHYVLVKKVLDTWIDPAETVPEIEPVTVEEVNNKVIELAELHEHDVQDLYALLEYAQDSRTRVSQRVAVDSHHVDLLMEDKIAHQETIQIVEDEAYAARSG